MSKKRGAFTVRAVEFLVARHAKAAGLDQHVHPHMLRHSCATHLLRRGAPLEAIRKLLGHQSLASTQVYLHLAPEDVRTALERHPIRRTWPRVWATAVSRTCTYQGARRARAGWASAKAWRHAFLKSGKGPLPPGERSTRVQGQGAPSRQGLVFCSARNSTSVACARVVMASGRKVPSGKPDMYPAATVSAMP